MVIFSFLLLGGVRVIQSAYYNGKLSIEKPILNQTPAPIQTAPELPNHLKNPSFLNSAKYNYQERFIGKLVYQFGVIGRGYITLALFILGLVIGRIRFFEQLDVNKKLNINLFIGFTLATILTSLALSFFYLLSIIAFYLIPE